jgi:predicted dehydrogenase
MSKKPIRLGIVGANAERGWAKDAHVPALKHLPRFQIAAVSAPTQERAEAAAKAFGAAHAFGDSLKLVKSPEVDVVVVSVRVPDHMPIVMGALEAGKHVFCEWPLGRDVTEAEAMTKAAAKAKVINIVGLQGPVAPEVRRAAEIVRSGALGRILSARVNSAALGWAPVVPPFYAYLNDKRTGATFTTIPGGHTLSMVEKVLGPFVEIQARNFMHHPKVKVMGTDQSVDRTCPDHIAIIGLHGSDCVSSIEIRGSRSMEAPCLFEIVGEKADFRLIGAKGGGFQTSALTLVTTVPFTPAAPLVPGVEGPGANVSELYAMLAAAIDCEKTEAPTFSDALHLTRVLAAVDAASDSGKRQSLGKS